MHLSSIDFLLLNMIDPEGIMEPEQAVCTRHVCVQLVVFCLSIWIPKLMRALAF